MVNSVLILLSPSLGIAPPPPPPAAHDVEYIYIYIYISIGRHLPGRLAGWLASVTSAGARYEKHPPRHSIAPGLTGGRAWLC